MEIRFSNKVNFGLGGMRPVIRSAAAKLDLANEVYPIFSSERDYQIRFRLARCDGSGVAPSVYDRLIKRLLNLDPDATIRTARAVYEGLADYEAQLKARRGE